MLLIIGLLVGLLLLLWLLNGALAVLGWVFKAAYYLGLAAWVTTLALGRGTRRSYQRVVQWRRERAAAALVRL